MSSGKQVHDNTDLELGDYDNGDIILNSKWIVEEILPGDLIEEDSKKTTSGERVKAVSTASSSSQTHLNKVVEDEETTSKSEAMAIHNFQSIEDGGDEVKPLAKPAPEPKIKIEEVEESTTQQQQAFLNFQQMETHQATITSNEAKSAVTSTGQAQTLSLIHI